MTLLNKIASFFGLVNKDNTGSRYIRMYPSKQAGMHVDHDTAMTLSAVFACIRLISEDIAKLPWQSFRKDAQNKRERLPQSPVERLLNIRPNPEMTAFSFRETLVAWALSWGNGYAEIERDSMRRPIALWPIAPHRVEPKRDTTGRLYYEVTNVVGPKTEIAIEDMFHLHGLGYDGLIGYSVISYAARSIGSGLAADEFTASFFGNNAVMGGYLEHPSKLGDIAYARLKEWLSSVSGSPTKAFSPSVLEEGMKWTQAGIPPLDAQLVESRKFTVNEVARWFRVPPHKIGDLERATFTNIEEQSISYVNDTLVSWITRLEQEANAKLLSARSIATYTKINVNALLRGSSAQRAAFYKELWAMGVYSVNEIREKEDENSIGPDGDKRAVQLNLTTLDKLGEDPPAATTVVPEEEEEVEAKAVHVKLLYNSLRGIHIKQDRRFQSAARDAEEPSFVEWLNRYMDMAGEHISWVASVLEDNLNTIAADLGGQDIVADSVLAYVPHHVAVSRNRAFSIYRSEAHLTVESISDAESKAVADSLIEAHLIKRLESRSHAQED